MKNITIVYFEDDVEKFKTTEDILRELKIQIIRIPRNEESLSKLNTLNPDMILVEHRLSATEHYRLLFKMDLLEKLSRIPKIVITNRGQTYDLLWSPQNPLWDYTAYPFYAQELIEKVIYWSRKKSKPIPLINSQIEKHHQRAAR